jgi:hypothetical protein
VGEAPNGGVLPFGDLLRYADAEDAAVYVEKLYEEGDLAQLGIGT